MSKNTDSVLEQLEDEILTGKLPPGFKLDEVSLAERFGVSRTPIREALFQLSAAGLVTRLPRKGNYVAEISPMRLVEMFDVLAMLESMAAKLAARRASQGDIMNIAKALQDCVDTIQNDESCDTYHFKNEAFHRSIHIAAHNEFLMFEIEQLHRRLRAYRRLQLKPCARKDPSLKGHNAIFDAIKEGDTEKARNFMLEHITVTGEVFIDLLSSITRNK